MVESSSDMSSQRKKHSWLSPIVVACCKSKMKQPGPGGTGFRSGVCPRPLARMKKEEEEGDNLNRNEIISF